jgi:hypothetical protein
LGQITFHFIIYYYKNVFFIVFSEVALLAAKSVKRDTVQFVFGTISNLSPHFFNSQIFIRCLLVGVREGLWVEISLSYKWKQIGIFLAPETSHIMALKIKDYIIYSLLLTHHYLRLIVDDHSYSGTSPERGRAPPPGGCLSWRLGILWLIVADHDCIYWLYLYGPDLLYLYLLL